MRTVHLFLILLSLVASPAFPQVAAINGQIEGTVTDPSGAAVPNARVEIVNVDTGFRRTGTTDEAGFYRFTVLPLGTYTVSVEAASFAPARNTDVVISAGRVATVNIGLGIAAVNREVIVTAAAPIVEPGRTDIGYTLGTNQVLNLPLVSRNSYNFILIQPNVSGNPNVEFGVPRKVNANGFADRINYQIDGSNNTQSDRAGIRLTPISNTYVQEVQQVNNGFAPEFGNTVGTVFNAITKSGTNQLHGEGAYLFRRTDMTARSTLLSRSAPKPEQSVDDPWVNAGGRVIKDRLFWFGAFEHVKRDIPQAVTVTPATIAALNLPPDYANAIPFSQNVYFYLGKMDWQINSNNRLSGRFSYFRNESPFNNGGGLTVASQTYLFKDRAPAWAFQLISTLTPNSVNELRFQVPKRFQRQVAFDGTGAQPAITISGLINFGGSEQTGFEFTETTPNVSENFSYVRGEHNYKFGADLRWILDKTIQATFARFTFANLAAYNAALSGTATKGYTNFTQTLGNPLIEYDSLFSGFYVQDNWKVRPTITVNYGVRYDLYRIPEADPTSLFAASTTFRVDKNNFAPRLGISWGIGKDQKTVIRANGGMFYDAPQTNIYQRAILTNGQPRFYSLSTGPTASFAPQFPSILNGLPSGAAVPGTRDIVTVSPDFRTMYSTNLNLQVTRELSSNLAVTASYLFTKGTGIPVYRNIDLTPSGASLADGRPIFSNIRPISQFNTVLMAESVGNSNYNGLNVMLNRRFSRGYDFFASYTWSHAIDDAPEQNVLDSSNLLPSDPTNRRRDRGNSLADRRHVFTASAVVNPTFDLGNKALAYIANNNRLSIMWSVRSGEAYNIGSNANLNNDPTIPASLQRPLFIGRNTFRGETINQMDLRYSRIFPIGERIRPEFFAEAWNFLNHSNMTGYNTTASVDPRGFITAMPNFRATAALDPRLFQLGVRVMF